MKKYTYTFKVEKQDIDFNGHVNNVTYLSWMIDAATAHSNAVGFSYASCLELGGTWVARAHHIQYKKPSFENDLLQMTTWIETIGSVLSRRHYLLTRVCDNAVISEGKTEWVFVDSQQMRPMKIPSEIKEGFENY